jgi:translation initiation factor 2 subunit 2
MSEGEYERLLNRALSKLPPRADKGGRFELPEPLSSISGNRTVLYNLNEICNRLNRDRDHLLKFLSREMATAGSLDGARAVFQGNFENRVFKRLLDMYVKDYVLCPICHQQDTKIVKKGHYHFLVCEACGATSSLRGI